MQCDDPAQRSHHKTGCRRDHRAGKDFGGGNYIVELVSAAPRVRTRSSRDRQQDQLADLAVLNERLAGDAGLVRPWEVSMRIGLHHLRPIQCSGCASLLSHDQLPSPPRCIWLRARARMRWLQARRLWSDRGLEQQCCCLSQARKRLDYLKCRRQQWEAVYEYVTKTDAAATLATIEEAYAKVLVISGAHAIAG